MDFSHLNNRLSRIDRVKPKQSIIDHKTVQLREKLQDRSLGEGLVAQALTYLPEAKIDAFADYAVRKANNPGRAFVKLCSNEIKKFTQSDQDQR